MGRVDGKIAIVTGGGTGIGRAAAARLAEEGAKVTIAEFNAESGQAVAEALGGDAVFVRHDVREEASWQALMEALASWPRKAIRPWARRRWSNGVRCRRSMWKVSFSAANMASPR